ncbi:MAG: DMT family transporter [Deltaproteobacteria bacterium]|nr:DMT family transporter [Deltaproteobacteria bacterium]
MNEALLGPLCAFAASITWSIGSSAYSHLSRTYAPGVVNFNRALVALPFFLLFIVLDFSGVRANIDALGPALSTHALWLTLSITSAYVIGDGLFMWSALSLGFPSAQAVGAIYPVWAAFAGWAFNAQAVSGGQAAGIALAVLGVIWVVVAGRGDTLRAVPDHLGFLRVKSVGVLFGVAASIMWAMNAFATSKGGAGIHFALANAFRLVLALSLCPVAARVQGARRMLFALSDYRRFGAIIAFEAVVGACVFLYGMSHSPVAVGATLSSLAPVLAVPIAVVLGWERFSVAKSLAVLLVVAGVALLVR